MRLAFVPIFLSVTVYAAPKYLNPSHRIVNGVPEKPGAVPYIVELEIHKPLKFNDCGGSIIDKNWILTAAHCTENALNVTIYYGTTDRESHDLYHVVSSDSIYQHKDYDINKDNDIALIKVPDIDFNTTDNINQIALPVNEDKYKSLDGQWAHTSGWGDTSTQGGYARHLLGIDLRIIERGNYALPANIIYAETFEGKSTCHGDSGGPLTVPDKSGELKLVGVTQAVIPIEGDNSTACESGFPNTFVRVSSYLDWIAQIQSAD